MACYTSKCKVKQTKGYTMNTTQNIIKNIEALEASEVYIDGNTVAEEKMESLENELHAALKESTEICNKDFTDDSMVGHIAKGEAADMCSHALVKELYDHNGWNSVVELVAEQVMIELINEAELARDPYHVAPRR